ncbi:hypothetical protein Vafri_16932 [Volvox africanus]|uniref:Flavodoxin-like domain-containing protein n=1 Tax=Volvox africanus TaxID=51714 RepID=A0A8J4BKZ0_9CHLO|nr:hypothetical protein Vafri_16932 [Volvox africanus]
MTPSTVCCFHPNCSPRTWRHQRVRLWTRTVGRVSETTGAITSSACLRRLHARLLLRWTSWIWFLLVVGPVRYLSGSIRPVRRCGGTFMAIYNHLTAQPTLRQSTYDLSKHPNSRSFFRSLLGLEKKGVAADGEGPAPATTAGAAAPAGVTPGSAPLPVCMLLPMHGPGVSSALTQLLQEYRKWVDEQIKAAATTCAAVFYASAYGNTAALAQAISRGITKGGVAVETVNLELASLQEVSEAVSRSQGFVLGSPTLGGHMPTQVSVAMGAIIREPSAKAMPCGVFGSFGWSGEAVDEMEGRLRDAGFGFAFDSIRVKFKPTAKDLLLCEESGRALAQSIKKRAKTKELSAAPGSRALNASGPQLAMGRVVGSLSVLTAKDEDATSAMLASWISQASFDPPGVTVAVKKDRAIEKLLIVGGKFAVSMVAEGRERPVMKALSRPFSPGEDRLADLETVPSPHLGVPLLKTANSFLECSVVTRMEAGDHYLIYAHVLEGKVLDENAPTAVHHRKVGNHY